MRKISLFFLLILLSYFNCLAQNTLNIKCTVTDYQAKPSGEVEVSFDRGANYQTTNKEGKLETLTEKNVVKNDIRVKGFEINNIEIKDIKNGKVIFIKLKEKTYDKIIGYVTNEFNRKVRGVKVYVDRLPPVITDSTGRFEIAHNRNALDCEYKITNDASSSQGKRILDKRGSASNNIIYIQIQDGRKPITEGFVFRQVDGKRKSIPGANVFLNDEVYITDNYGKFRLREAQDRDVRFTVNNFNVIQQYAELNTMAIIVEGNVDNADSSKLTYSVPIDTKTNEEKNELLNSSSILDKAIEKLDEEIVGLLAKRKNLEESKTILDTKLKELYDKLANNKNLSKEEREQLEYEKKNFEERLSQNQNEYQAIEIKYEKLKAQSENKIKLLKEIIAKGQKQIDAKTEEVNEANDQLEANTVKTNVLLIISLLVVIFFLILLTIFYIFNKRIDKKNKNLTISYALIHEQKEALEVQKDELNQKSVEILQIIKELTEANTNYKTTLVLIREKNTQLEVQKKELELTTDELKFQYDIGQLQKQNLEERTQELEALTEELKQQTDTLEEQKEDLQTLQTTKDLMISAINHDLRNPLNPIINYSSPTFPNPDKTKILQKIHFRSKRMKTMVEEVMYIYQADKLEMQKSSNQIRKTVQSAITLISDYQSQMPEIRNEVSESLQGIYNEDYIRRVVENLLVNAVKFSNGVDNPTVIVSALVENGKLHLQIQDNGWGIPPEKLKELQQGVAQFDNKRNTSEKGFGIGLQFCNTVLRLHESHLEIHSKGEDKGSTFGFALPQAQGNIQTSSDQAQPLNLEDAIQSMTISAQIKEVWQPYWEDLRAMDLYHQKLRPTLDLIEKRDASSQEIIKLFKECILFDEENLYHKLLVKLRN